MSEAQELAKQSDEIINMVAQDLVNTIGVPFALGHAFLWVRFKVGKRSFKTLAASGACNNWGEIENELKKACPEITSTWINLD